MFGVAFQLQSPLYPMECALAYTADKTEPLCR